MKRCETSIGDCHNKAVRKSHAHLTAQSLYVRWGDWWAYLCGGMGLVALGNHKSVKHRNESEL